MEQNKKFTNYEYKSVVVNRDKESVWKDSYQNMGWELEKSQPAIVKHVFGPIRIMIAPLAIIPGTPFAKMAVDHKSETKVELTFKRNRNLDNKAEINRLQLKFESAVKTIGQLEDSRITGAATASYMIGLLGTIFMAGSVFSYLGGFLLPSIVLAVPGFICWLVSYFAYRGFKDKKTRKVAPMIEEQYDTIYDICQKANVLI